MRFGHDIIITRLRPRFFLLVALTLLQIESQALFLTTLVETFESLLKSKVLLLSTSFSNNKKKKKKQRIHV